MPAISRLAVVPDAVDVDPHGDALLRVVEQDRRGVEAQAVGNDLARLPQSGGLPGRKGPGLVLAPVGRVAAAQLHRRAGGVRVDRFGLDLHAHRLHPRSHPVPQVLLGENLLVRLDLGIAVDHVGDERGHAERCS